MLILKGSKKLSIAFFKSKSVIKCDLLLAFNDTAKAAWLFLRVRLINNSFLKSTKFQSCSKCVILAEFEKLLMQKKKIIKSILNGKKERLELISKAHSQISCIKLSSSSGDWLFFVFVETQNTTKTAASLTETHYYSSAEVNTANCPLRQPLNSQKKIFAMKNPPYMIQVIFPLTPQELDQR